jgi:hypothetical protein
MQITVKIKRFQFYLCIGKVYDSCLDSLAQTGLRAAWLGKKQFWVLDLQKGLYDAAKS